MIKKLFENRIETVRIVTRIPRGRTRRERNLLSNRKKISFSSSEEETMSKSPPREQRVQKNKGQATEKSKGQSDMELDISRKRPRDEDISKQKEDAGKNQSERQEGTLDLGGIKEILDRGGAGHLFDEIRKEVAGIINQALEKQAKSMKKMIEEQKRLEKEHDKCSRSILIHNADRLVVEEYDSLVGYSLAEKVTEALHTLCRCMITIVEAFPMGRYVEGRPVTSICVVLGSSRQKAVVYKTIIAHIRRQPAIGKAISRVSMRDVFPKEMIPEAQNLVRKGLGLKREGTVEAFKVAAMGTGVIPVLYVKYKYENGSVSYWEVYQSREEREEEGNQDQERAGEEDWEQVRSKRRSVPVVPQPGSSGKSSSRGPDGGERHQDFPDLNESNQDRQRQRQTKK